MTDSTPPFRLARLSYDDIRVQADEFLEKYHPTRTFPVPIDKIVEFGLSMQIIPISDLSSVFGVDAFLSNDIENVYVDAAAMVSEEAAA